MSKLITINGYSIKLSKKEVANKLEMLFTTCTSINMDNLDKNISLVLGSVENYCDCLLVKKAFNIKYAISNGEYFFKCITLKSSANLTDSVKELMLICDMLIKCGKVEYANKLLPNYRPDWFNKGQEVENTKPAEPTETTLNAETTVNAEPVEKPMFAYVKEKATKKNAIIRSTYATKKNFISDLRHNGYAVRYVCLDTPEEIEKASQKYHDNLDLQRNIQRAKREHAPNPVEYANMTNDLVEFLKELKIIVSNEYEEYNGEKSKLTKYQLKLFYDKVNFIKNVLGYKGIIINGELNHNEYALGSYVCSPRVIVIDNSFIDDCFSGYANTHGKDIFGNDIIEVICHEIAHDTYFFHGRWHSRLTTQLYEKVKAYENANENTNETKNEKEVKKSMEKSNRNFKLNSVNYTVVNNPNYNKNCSYEPTCQKYYAMKLLSTDGVTKSWVKTGITANTIATVKEKVAEWEDFMQYVENYDNTNTAKVTNKINVEPSEPVTPVTPVKDTNNLKLSDDAITHIRNAYNWIIGGLINGLCDNKPDTLEYKECFNMLHGGEKLVNHIYNECLENGFDIGWCGLGQAPAEIKKYDGWLIKNHIRNMLDLDNIFSLPNDNDIILNEIHNIPAKKLDSILDLIEQCNSTMEKTMLLDYVSFETGVSYDAIKQIYDVYIKETFLDDDETTFDSVLEEIYSTGCVVGIDDDTVKDFKRILGDDEIPF